MASRLIVRRAQQWEVDFSRLCDTVQSRPRRTFKALALLAASFSLASADPITCIGNADPSDHNCYLHHVVYIDESLTAYYLLPSKKGPTQHIIPFEVLPGGIPTVEYKVGEDRRIVTTGDILLRDPVTHGTQSESDLIRFIKGGSNGGTDPNCGKTFQYCLQFFSDKDPSNPLPADVGLPSFALSQTRVEIEDDLTDATKFWRLKPASSPQDPNSQLNLKGKRGFAYIAFAHPAPSLEDPNPKPNIGSVPQEDPVGYVFVSDDDVLPGPEASSLVLFGTVAGVIAAGYLRRRRTDATGVRISP